MSDFRRLTVLRAGVLRLLAHGPQRPVELHGKLDALGIAPATPSVLCQNSLNAMKDQGLVQSKIVSGSHSVYSITAKGTQVLGQITRFLAETELPTPEGASRHAVA